MHGMLRCCCDVIAYPCMPLPDSCRCPACTSFCQTKLSLLGSARWRMDPAGSRLWRVHQLGPTTAKHLKLGLSAALADTWRNEEGQAGTGLLSTTHSSCRLAMLLLHSQRLRNYKPFLSGSPKIQAQRSWDPQWSTPFPWVWFRLAPEPPP